jgi:aryl-alcohol dehydrogenase-like predicted oxidoreductase
MLYCDFGKTGLKVSAVGLGTWNIGNQWGEIDEDTALATVHAAIDHGVNIIDTAESYGISTDKPEVLEGFNVQNTCSVVELDYSLLNRKPEKKMLPYCQAHGIAVVARGPLGKGLLTGKYAADAVFTDTVRSEWYATEGDREKLASKLAKIERLKTSLAPGKEMVRAALQFVTSHPCQPVIIPGAKSPEQAVMNAQAGDSTLSADERSALIRLLKAETAELQPAVSASHLH